MFAAAAMMRCLHVRADTRALYTLDVDVIIFHYHAVYAMRVPRRQCRI